MRIKGRKHAVEGVDGGPSLLEQMMGIIAARDKSHMTSIGNSRNLPYHASKGLE